MPTLDFAHARSSTMGEPAAALAVARPRRSTLAIVPLHDDMWRVTSSAGEVVGYVERFGSPAGVRFRAKRLLPRQRRFMVDGEFWSMDDAVACFR